MRKPLLFWVMAACPMAALGDEISDNFDAMAKSVKVAADIGDRCVADYQSTKDKTQCDRFDAAFTDFRMKQKAWQQSTHGDPRVAELSARQQLAEFQSDVMRMNKTLQFIGEREDEFPLK